ncbi:dehydrogenase, partial [Bacillus sp. 7586-K]
MKTFSIEINGKTYEASSEQSIFEIAKNHSDLYIPGICSYQPQVGVGVLQTCDTCMVEINGELKRACATKAEPEMKVNTNSQKTQAAQHEAMSRILKNHELYCTVCDNNNGNCEVHNTAEHLGIEHQKYPFEPKP